MERARATDLLDIPGVIRQGATQRNLDPLRCALIFRVEMVYVCNQKEYAQGSTTAEG